MSRRRVPATRCESCPKDAGPHVSICPTPFLPLSPSSLIPSLAPHLVLSLASLPLCLPPPHIWLSLSVHFSNHSLLSPSPLSPFSSVHSLYASPLSPPPSVPFSFYLLCVHVLLSFCPHPPTHVPLHLCVLSPPAGASSRPRADHQASSSSAGSPGPAARGSTAPG